MNTKQIRFDCGFWVFKPQSKQLWRSSTNLNNVSWLVIAPNNFFSKLTCMRHIPLFIITLLNNTAVLLKSANCDTNGWAKPLLYFISVGRLLVFVIKQGSVVYCVVIESGSISKGSLDTHPLTGSPLTATTKEGMESGDKKLGKKSETQRTATCW